jgi:hypothetical protein
LGNRDSDDALQEAAAQDPLTLPVDALQGGGASPFERAVDPVIQFLSQCGELSNGFTQVVV